MSLPSLPHYSYRPNVAVLWLLGSKLVILPSLSKDHPSAAYGISEDGQLIVGTSAGIPCIWRQKNSEWNVTSLSTQPGQAKGITPDGTVIHGCSGNQVFVWTPTRHLCYVNDLLREQAIENSEGWQIEEILQISKDFSAFVFIGRRPDGKRTSGRVYLKTPLYTPPTPNEDLSRSPSARLSLTTSTILSTIRGTFHTGLSLLHFSISTGA
jgi:hypothetical protein